MNTIYASVGARTREIGTLRVLGYRRGAIMASFLIEGAFLALLGGRDLGVALQIIGQDQTWPVPAPFHAADALD